MDKPLAQQYPYLYNIVQHKNVFVASVLSRFPINIAFQRNLTSLRWGRWLHLLSCIIDINLTVEKRHLSMEMSTSRKIIIKSMYLDLLSGTIYVRKYMWKIKVSLKMIILCHMENTYGRWFQRNLASQSNLS
jgi:hypothetical protein